MLIDRQKQIFNLYLSVRYLIVCVYMCVCHCVSENVSENAMWTKKTSQELNIAPSSF